MSRSVPIPADIDQEDKLLGGLTARQLLIIAVPTALFWSLFLLTRKWLPVFVLIPPGVITCGVVGALIIGKRDGLSLDRFLIAALKHRIKPHLMAPGITSEQPFNGEAQSSTAPLTLPIYDIDADGVIDLGRYGAALICEAKSVNFSLQTQADQDALSAAFGRFCNSLSESIQFVVRSSPVDLSTSISMLKDAASHMGSSGLEQSAVDHAEFLAQLSTRGDVLRRTVNVVFRDTRPIGDCAPRLLRRREEAMSGLRTAGVELIPLGFEQSTKALQNACSAGKYQAPLSNSFVVTGGIK